ncbi:MAG: shikimate dehydrogenase, partial [Atribacterota bacterium]|nr:shikimate dehydrogenase [Atribacterota bacterium]
MITAQTRLLGVIGYPIEHSLSPLFQNAALSYLGLPFVYLAFDILPSNLERALEAMRIFSIRGFNVTIPYKEKV